jgi:hypothetical protein
MKAINNGKVVGSKGKGKGIQVGIVKRIWNGNECEFIAVSTEGKPGDKVLGILWNRGFKYSDQDKTWYYPNNTEESKTNKMVALALIEENREWFTTKKDKSGKPITQAYMLEWACQNPVGKVSRRLKDRKPHDLESLRDPKVEIPQENPVTPGKGSAKPSQMSEVKAMFTEIKSGMNEITASVNKMVESNINLTNAVLSLVETIKPNK